MAAGIPVATKVQPQRHLVERLESVLRAAAEALGCKAAAAYLLDDATTELKLRAAWGLPEDRLMEPARPLRGAKADLEALAGHAVALEDATLFPHWNLPEPARPAAVCVPISSPTELLGTLWVFADEKRPFSDHEVNLVELSAGRIAADLEREVLLTETRQREDLRRDWDEAVQHRRVREPQVAPLVEGWDIVGTMQQPEEALGEFYDWLVPEEGAVTTAVGRVEEKGLAAALSVESLRSAWRAHVHHERDLTKLLERVNDDLWRRPWSLRRPICWACAWRPTAPCAGPAADAARPYGFPATKRRPCADARV
ncbi:MAG: GAF domain-containing protein [Pirellulales bacterium]